MFSMEKYPVGSGVSTKVSKVLSLSISKGTALNSKGTSKSPSKGTDHFILVSLSYRYSRVTPTIYDNLSALTILY